MVLPLNLALTPAEISVQTAFPCPIAYMACSFSPYTLGLSGIPTALPSGSMLIVNDRMSCQGHSADLVVDQLQKAIDALQCESILLDFQRPPEPESELMVHRIVDALSCPVAVTEGYAAAINCPVFLSSGPMHIPLADHLDPWRHREIWLEAALGQSDIKVTETGVTAAPYFPADGLSGGFYDETLCCQYRTRIDPDQVIFTLFDTLESLEKKLELAASLGVKRAVGLWQELGTFQSGKQPACTSIAGKNHS